MEIQSKKIIVKPNCRKVHGVEGAIDTGLGIIKDAYLRDIKAPINSEADFEITMVIKR